MKRFASRIQLTDKQSVFSLLHVYDVKWSDRNRKSKSWNLWFDDEDCANCCIFFLSSLFHSFVRFEMQKNLHCFLGPFTLYRFCCGHLKQSYTTRNRWKQDVAINFSKMPKMLFIRTNRRDEPKMKRTVEKELQKKM